MPSPVTIDKFWTIFKLRVRAVADDVATEAELYDANIGANLSPVPVTIYVDDAAISRSRVGPDGILED